MSVQTIVNDGLCTQCGTCAGICPSGAISLPWRLRTGLLPVVDAERCTECGACLRACPGPGIDMSEGAWWRSPAEGADARDFLGPWRSLWFGWVSDEATRHEGASGGIATALLTGAVQEGLVDAAICARAGSGNALSVEPFVLRDAASIAACRGSKYNLVAMNLALAEVLRRPGRYALIGLPCHVQGLRLAQQHSSALRERVVVTIGIFCGWSSLPRATEFVVRRAGLDPASLTSVRYRGPGWPGGMELTSSDGRRWQKPYPDYFDRLMYAYTPPRCRLCPDALAELADVSLGDAWLDRFAGSPGVSDLIVRTPVGEDLIGRLADRLVLAPASPEAVIASQRDTYAMKRPVFRGRLWLRALRGRPVPRYPGVRMRPSPSDALAGVKDLVGEIVFRALGDLRYR